DTVGWAPRTAQCVADSGQVELRLGWAGQGRAGLSCWELVPLDKAAPRLAKDQQINKRSPVPVTFVT
ncbi:hypothetical protein chiPu_0028933, partial [Chiloscyllium punctatum]|nr:hypothetical protein [Chiloscyllium punctatum]